MHRRSLLALTAFLLLLPLARAEEESDLPEVLEGLSGAEILELLEPLASDDMQGRKTGFTSGGLAEKYVAGKMVDFGLDPADRAGAYLEPFTFPAQHTTAASLRVGTDELTFGDDFVDLGYTGSGTANAEVVFCGYGIHRPDQGWDDYAGVDVKGKIVMAIRGAPAAMAAEFHDERYIGSKSSTAADRGAAGLILVQGESASSGTIQARFHRADLPAVWVSGAVADRVLKPTGRTLAELKKTRDEGKPGRSFPTKTKVRIAVESTFLPHAKGSNVLGMIKGRDEELTGEVVIVAAHIDHLGVAPTGAVFNGADDNASGTAVMLHLADKLMLNRWRPKRTIVFCGFAAEEQGLHGSRALATSIPFPYSGIACVLNMDMVGQGEPRVNVSGVGAYPEIARVLRAGVPPSLEDKVHFSPRTGPGSDHWPFHELGVPAFFIGTKGAHPNYHTPKDDIGAMKPDVLEAAATQVGALLVALGDHPESLLDGAAFGHYLTREGPRFVLERTLEGDVGTQALLERGISCVVRDVSAPTLEAARARWTELEAEAEAAGVVLAKGAPDLDRAWSQGKLAWLPRLDCREVFRTATPAAAAPLREIGYRWVVPFDGQAGAMNAALGTALHEAGLLVDLTGHAGKAPPTATVELVGVDETPFAVRRDRPDLAADRHVALFVEADGKVAGAAQVIEADGCLLVADTGLLLAALTTWVGTQDATWWMGGSQARTTLRRALGGRLMAVLRSLDR